MNILNTGKAYQKIQPRDAGPKEPDWDDSVLIAICLFLEISKLLLKFWLETFTLFDKQVIIHSQKSLKMLLYENLSFQRKIETLYEKQFLVGKIPILAEFLFEKNPQD